MLKPDQWLNALRTASGARSDYHLAQLLGVTTSAVCNYANGRRTFSPELAPKICEFIQVPPHVAVMAFHYWQAKSETERQSFAVAYKLMGGTQADEIIQELAEHKLAA